jgi:hypothetical protein
MAQHKEISRQAVTKVDDKTNFLPVCYPTQNTTHSQPVDLSPSKKTATTASQGHSINKKSHKKHYKILEDFNIIRHF